MNSFSILRFGKEINELTINDIQLLIDNKIDESQNLDYKQPSNDSQVNSNNLAEVISSFLNTDGGIIVFGVAESKDKENHRFPDKIIWTKEPKERIENLLFSRVQPWFEGIKVQRISNDIEPTEGVYVIEVPKSNNPPHMFNGKYYQRLNFQIKPMSHESVYRAFQTSSIRRNDIITQVIMPLYSEIKCDRENIRNYNGVLCSKYYFIIENNRFLYDLLDKADRKKIDEFYIGLVKYQEILSKVYNCTTKIINEGLCKADPYLSSSLNMNTDNFVINLTLKDASGNIYHANEVSIREAFLKRKPFFSYLQSLYPLDEIIKMNAMTKYSPQVNLSLKQLEVFWKNCKSNAKQNELYLLMWKERRELLELSKNILKELAN